jgi:phytanoyl-CoA hydroxylase
MYALPGGHRLPLKRRFRRDQNNGVTFEELDPTPWPVDGYIPLEAKKGTLILLHALLPHLSGPNSSDQSRHAYTVHIVEGTADYPKENWLQRSAERPALGF